MSHRNRNEAQLSEYADQLNQVNKRLSRLETAENDMLLNLQKSVNEHNRLQNLSYTGGATSQSVIDS